MTAKTPVYGLEYLVQGEPVRNTRAALEANAKTIEAALLARGVPATGAADLAALAGRVARLENPVSAVMRATAAQSVPGGWADILLHTEDEDSHGGHSTTVNVNRWTCPVGEAGLYHVEGNVLWGGMNLGTNINARLVKNGQVLPNGPGATGAYGGPAGASSLTGSKLIRLVAGDWVGLQAWCGQANVQTAVFSDAASSMTLWRVRL
jgi:hypothetical protein